MRAPTGEQYPIRRGDSSVVITQVGAGLREYTVGGVDVVEPFPEHSTPPSAAGIILSPWPNRIRDGKWAQGDVVHQLDISEPARGNAMHGLLRYTQYRMTDHTPESVTLTATVYPRRGYPFQLDTGVRYRLVAGGLEVEYRVQNAGPTRAPVAVGAHPFLKIGDVPTSDLTLTVNAGSHVTLDERMLPVGEHPVAGTEFDLRGGVRVGDLTLDDAFGDLDLIAGASAQVLTAPDGRSVTLWGDEGIKYVQVFTTRSFGTETAGDVAIAIEPMSAPADAFNSGQDLRWLDAGESWTLRWGIRPDGFQTTTVASTGLWG